MKQNFKQMERNTIFTIHISLNEATGKRTMYWFWGESNRKYIGRNGDFYGYSISMLSLTSNYAETFPIFPSIYVVVPLNDGFHEQ
jgi:hypothetical protein